MKFLAQTISPTLTFTRTNRKCIIDEAIDLITLYETTTKLEVSWPSIRHGLNSLKDRFYCFLGGLLLPKIYAC